MIKDTQPNKKGIKYENKKISLKTKENIKKKEGEHDRAVAMISS